MIHALQRAYSTPVTEPEVTARVLVCYVGRMVVFIHVASHSIYSATVDWLHILEIMVETTLLRHLPERFIVAATPTISTPNQNLNMGRLRVKQRAFETA